MTDEQWHAIVDLHLKAPFDILRAAQPVIGATVKKEKAKGRVVHPEVVNISSVAGVFGNPGQADYSAAKAGVVGLAKTLAKEWDRYNVNVNVVAFGFISTRLTEVSADVGSPISVEARELKVGVAGRRPRDRKHQILNAARELFVEQGFPNVTMAQIAEQVGITAGALYRHFTNKAVLLEAIFADSFDWIEEPLPDLDLAEAVDVLLARLIDKPYISDLWSREIRYLPPERRGQLRRQMRAWNGSLIPGLRLERPDVDEAQAELLAWAFASVMSGVGRRAMQVPMTTRLEVIHAALLALTQTELLPVGRPVLGGRQRLAPASVRERLLLAAVELFGERGYRDTSMAGIGALANVTGPNLYSYFENKAGVLRAVLERGTHALWLGLGEALRSANTPTEALRELARSYIEVSGSWASTLEDPMSGTGLDEFKTVQREYVREWVALLQQILPDLGQQHARARVQLGLFLIADLQVNPRLARAESFRDNLVRLVMALLLGGRITRLVTVGSVDPSGETKKVRDGRG